MILSNYAHAHTVETRPFLLPSNRPGYEASGECEDDIMREVGNASLIHRMCLRAY